MASPSSPAHAPPLSSILIRAAASALAGDGEDDVVEQREDDEHFPTTYASVDGGGAGSGSYRGRRRRGEHGYYGDEDEHERGLIELIHSIFAFVATLIRTTIWTTAILSASVVIYGAFYVAVMPTVSVRRPLYFDYMHEVVQVQHHHRSVMPSDLGAGGDPYNNDASVLGRDEARVDRDRFSARNYEKEGAGDDADGACCTRRIDGSGENEDDVVGGENGDEGGRCDCRSDDAAEPPTSDLPPPPRTPPRASGSWEGRSSEMATTSSHEVRHHHHSYYYVPTATVDLLSPHDQWDAYHHHPHHHHDHHHNPNPEGDDDDAGAKAYSSPLPSPRPRLLSPGTRHYVEVALTLPESPSNLNVGVFMVQLELLSDDRHDQHQHHDGSNDRRRPDDDDGSSSTVGRREPTLLARSRRPALFPYESSLIRYVRKLSLLPPLLIGAMPEARTVVVPSLTHFVDDDEYRPLRRARVRILIPPHEHDRRPQWRRQVQILSAELRIGREPNAFQSLLREWFFTCATVGVSLIASALGFTVLLIRMTFWALAARAKARAAECEEEEDGSHDGGRGGDDGNWREVDDGDDGVGSLAASSLDVDVDDLRSGAAAACVDDEIMEDEDDDDVEVDGAAAEGGAEWEDFDGDWEELLDDTNTSRRRRRGGAGASQPRTPPAHAARARAGSGTGRRRGCRDGRRNGGNDGPHPSTPSSPPDLEEDTDDVGGGRGPKMGRPKRDTSSGREGDDEDDDSSACGPNGQPATKRNPDDREDGEGGRESQPPESARHRSGGRRKKSGKKKKRFKIKKKRGRDAAAAGGGPATGAAAGDDAAANADDPSCEKSPPANDKKSEEAELDEKVRVERVMRGLVEPYEIFTGEQTQTHVNRGSDDRDVDAADDR